MAKEIIGSFIFINQGYGILSSVYHNTHAKEPYPETAKRVAPEKDQTPFSFAGTYDTIWLEEDRHYGRRLEITVTTSGTFILKWILVRTEKLVFEGVGMLYDGKLIGCYWNTD